MTRETRNRADLGRTNRRAVLAEVVLNGPLPRTGIAQATGLTTAAISRITRDLIEAGLLIELPEDIGDQEMARRSPGRRFVQLDVNALGGYVLGIGVNVFSQSVTLADLKNRRLARTDMKLRDLSNPDHVIEQLTETASAMIDAQVIDRQRLLGAGISITGTVNPADGSVRTSHYLGWPTVPLAEKLSEALGIPVHVENQPNAQALAETKFGSVRGVKDLMVLNANLGIGGSLLVQGRITHGRDYRAGMIGTTTAPGVGSLTLDEMAGGVSIIRRLRNGASDLGNIPPDTMAKHLDAALQSAADGDGKTRTALAEAGQCLGESVSQMVSFIQPDAVLVTGPLAQVDVYTDACREAIQANSSNKGIRVLAGNMTAQAAARWVAIDEFLLERDLDLENLKHSKAA